MNHKLRNAIVIAALVAAMFTLVATVVVRDDSSGGSTMSQGTLNTAPLTLMTDGVACLFADQVTFVASATAAAKCSVYVVYGSQDNIYWTPAVTVSSGANGPTGTICLGGSATDSLYPVASTASMLPGLLTTTTTASVMTAGTGTNTTTTINTVGGGAFIPYRFLRAKIITATGATSGTLSLRGYSHFRNADDAGRSSQPLP